jgi:myo-inositol-1(or 4)-monophosphatase
MHALLNVAVMAARRAGETLIRKMVSLDKLKIEEKGHNDFVSDADRAAERAVISTVQKHYPDHAFLAEESGVSGESDHVWIIDPLDGTTNFLHGFPVFAVSIGVQVSGRMEHACVYDPLRQELFTASRGDGAQLDGHRLRVSGQKLLARALIGTGFPFRQADQDIGPYMAMLGKVITNTSGVRRGGKAAQEQKKKKNRPPHPPRGRRHHFGAGRQRELPGIRSRALRHAEGLRRPGEALRA